MVFFPAGRPRNVRLLLMGICSGIVDRQTNRMGQEEWQVVAYGHVTIQLSYCTKTNLTWSARAFLTFLLREVYYENTGSTNGSLFPSNIHKAITG